MMKKACPSDEMLADYLQGHLAEKEGSEMEEHLSDCTICLEELVIANSLFQGANLPQLDAVPAEVTEAAVRLMQSLDSAESDSLSEKFERAIKDLPTRISDFLNHKTWAELQPQPVRGFKRKVAKDLVLLKKTFEDVESEIEIEKMGENKALIRVRLLLADLTSQKIRVTLKKGDREIVSHLAEEAYVLFEDIPFGHYSLTFARDGLTLGTYLFEIKETAHDRR
jgi:hypothetical protein